MRISSIFSQHGPLVRAADPSGRSRAASWEVVVLVSRIGGLLLWIFGRRRYTWGERARFGAGAFLILSGLLEKRIIPLLIALMVGFLYGGSLVLGVIPRIGSRISWDGHLCGALAGGVVALALARIGGVLRQDTRRGP